MSAQSWLDRAGPAQWVTGLILALSVLLVPGGAVAELQPSSDVLLPYFEVDLQAPQRTTLFAVVNGSHQTVEVLVTLYSNWGLPVLGLTRVLHDDEVLSVNLRDWLVLGSLPDRKLDAEELRYLQAALTGLASPRDGLFYGSAVVPGRAVGYVTFRTQGLERPDTLWGDYLIVDPQQGFAQGETLVDVDPAAAPCKRHAVRFLAGGGPEPGTELMIWTGRGAEPSREASLGNAARRRIRILAVDEAGHHTDLRQLRSLPVERIDVASLGLSETYGWLEIETEEDSFVSAHFSGRDGTSAAVHAYCLPAVAHGGPALRIEKFTNGQDADTAPGPTLRPGQPVLWEYAVTNEGGVRISKIAVSDDDAALAVSCPGDALAPGESMICTAEGVAGACQYRNVGTAAGRLPDGSGIAAEDASHYFAEPPAAVRLETTANGQDADDPPGPEVRVGDPVAWSYRVTNSGEAVLTGVAVRDNLRGAVRCPQSTLQPGEMMICTLYGIAGPGPHRNLGIVTAKTPCGVAVSAEDPSHYFGRSPQGCAAGYWSSHTAAWPAGYVPGKAVQSVFRESGHYPYLAMASLGQALGFTGGGTDRVGAASTLLRAAVAALLNAAHPDIDSPRTPQQVVAEVNAALAGDSRDAMLVLFTALERDNQSGCPLH